jgi:DNA modification methylase
MGWGGRLVGACIAGVPKYIGIDTNRNLEAPYKNMCEQLKKLSPCTDAQLLFVDALTVDYSAFEYDMVFTSPPYYNKEIYGQGYGQGYEPLGQGYEPLGQGYEPLGQGYEPLGQGYEPLGQGFSQGFKQCIKDKCTNKKDRTEDEWNEQFYLPLFKKTWANLKVGGHYCLNVPSQLYDKICEPLLGPAQEQMELKKFARTLPDRDTARKNVGQKYKEFIYIWIKK